MAAAIRPSMRNLTFCKLKVLRTIFYNCRLMSNKKRNIHKRNLEESKSGSKSKDAQKQWRGTEFKRPKLQLENVNDDYDLDNRDKSNMQESYRDMINRRLKEADRSLLLQLKRNDQLVDVLTSVEKRIGPIEKGFYFKNYYQSKRNLVLIEFSSDKMLQSMAESRVRSTAKLKILNKTEDESLMEKITVYKKKNLCLKTLNDCINISDQIRYLYNTRKMSEANIRLQFFICMLINRSLKPDLDGVKVLPFGSWSCGLALDGSSDVDVSLMHKHGRGFLRHVSKLFNDSLLFREHLFLGKARVPIIKLKQVQTEMSVDICSNGLSGLFMAELLYLLNMYAAVFHPLVLTVKTVAKHHQLCQSGPTSKYSSFMLTMMVLSYLQQKGVLPALKYLITENGSKYTDALGQWRGTEFKRPKLQLKNVYDDDDLGELLIGFFKYYKTFKFKNYIIDPYEGKVVEMTHVNSVCIINPFESHHNICKNVSVIEVDKFENACYKFHEILLKSKKTVDKSWGLASLLGNTEFNSKVQQLKTNINQLYRSDFDFVEDVCVSMDGEKDIFVIDGKEQDQDVASDVNGAQQKNSSSISLTEHLYSDSPIAPQKSLANILTEDLSSYSQFPSSVLKESKNIRKRSRYWYNKRKNR